ncbi:hypothetical protein VNO80_16444 [Phaseolus coccineus]|uniref:Uncharacterized protein n=1 Tax=Phaseolus coccineus TaxID=3886 RepID=A0AAN9MNJ6_PHACN
MGRLRCGGQDSSVFYGGHGLHPSCSTKLQSTRETYTFERGPGLCLAIETKLTEKEGKEAKAIDSANSGNATTVAQSLVKISISYF